MSFTSDVMEKISSSNLSSQKDHVKAGNALKMAMTMDMENKAGSLRVAELMSGAGFPSTDPVATVERFQAAQLYDNGYEAIFKNIPINAPHTTWDIFSGGTGIVFEELEAGGKIRTSTTTGSKTTASIKYYAAGFEILQQWVENQQWWLVGSEAQDFVNAYQKKKAQIYYGIIDAVSAGQNLAWVAGANTLARDVATINAAVAALITSAQANEMPISMSQPYVIATPYALWPRIKAAISQYGSINDSRATYGELLYNIVPIATTFLTDSTKYYVCIPGEKSQRADRKALTSEKGRNLINLSDLEVRYAAWGGAIGDETQFQRCATA